MDKKVVLRRAEDLFEITKIGLNTEEEEKIEPVNGFLTTIILVSGQGSIDKGGTETTLWDGEEVVTTKKDHTVVIKNYLKEELVFMVVVSKRN